MLAIRPIMSFFCHYCNHDEGYLGPTEARTASRASVGNDAGAARESGQGPKPILRLPGLRDYGFGLIGFRFEGLGFGG